MAGKISRDEVLRGILRSLVDGWGYSAVQLSLENLEAETGTDQRPSRPRKSGIDRGSSIALVQRLSLPPEKTALLLALARQYEEGTAFPTLGDAKAFLLLHQRNAKDIKSRSQAFTRMLSVLARMSEKGLEKVISRSHHSGPAELESISMAIRGAGEAMRGPTSSRYTPSLEDNMRATGEDTPTRGEGSGDDSRQRQAKHKPPGERENGLGDKRK